MNLWQLESVCTSEPALMERLGDRPEWSEYLASYRQFDELVRVQDRATLDRELPNDLCSHVLVASRQSYYVSGGHVRVRPFGPDNQTITALDVFNAFGGAFLADVHEAGLAQMPAMPRVAGRSGRKPPAAWVSDDGTLYIDRPLRGNPIFFGLFVGAVLIIIPALVVFYLPSIFSGLPDWVLVPAGVLGVFICAALGQAAARIAQARRPKG